MPIQSRTIILPRSRRPLTYELERKAVKNLNLRVRVDGTAHLSIPKATAIAAAEAFLCSREEWILSALARMEKRAEVLRKTEETGDSLPYLGGTLAVVWRAGTPAHVGVVGIGKRYDQTPLLRVRLHPRRRPCPPYHR